MPIKKRADTVAFIVLCLVCVCILILQYYQFWGIFFPMITVAFLITTLLLSEKYHKPQNEYEGIELSDEMLERKKKYKKRKKIIRGIGCAFLGIGVVLLILDKSGQIVINDFKDIEFLVYPLLMILSLVIYQLENV